MGNVTAVAEHRFESLSPDAVYEAWLNPARVRIWMQRNIEREGGQGIISSIDIDRRPGGKYRFVSEEQEIENPTWGYYRELVSSRRIVFTWFVEEQEEIDDNSTVTLELTPAGQGCLATIKHDMDEQWVDYLEPTAKAWRGMLESIDEALG